MYNRQDSCSRLGRWGILAVILLAAEIAYAEKHVGSNDYQKPGAPVRVASNSRQHVVTPGVDVSLPIELDSSVNFNEVTRVDVHIHTTDGLVLLSNPELSGAPEAISEFTINVYAETAGHYYVYFTVAQYFADGSVMTRALGAGVTAVSAAADKTLVQKTKHAAIKKTGEIRDINGQVVIELPAQETIR